MAITVLSHSRNAISCEQVLKVARTPAASDVSRSIGISRKLDLCPVGLDKFP